MFLQYEKILHSNNNISHVALVHWAKFLEFRIFAQINSENIILSETERAMNLIIQSAAWFWI